MTHEPTPILVPTDFSPASDRALALAQDLGHQHDAEIHLLYVRQVVDEPDVKSEILDEVERVLCDSEDEILHSLERRADGGTARIHGHVRRGFVPAEMIVDAAEEFACELIVIGTHGRRGFRRFLMGSVAEEVVHSSPVPVLTTRAEAGGGHYPPSRILVGVSASDESIEAVKWAGRAARVLPAEVTLLHVIEPVVCPEFYELEPVIKQYQRQITKRSHEALAKLGEFHLEGVEFNTSVVNSPVAEGIATFAGDNDFDLVVLAARDRSALSHTLLGSVAERVVRLSEVPVLTLRE